MRELYARSPRVSSFSRSLVPRVISHFASVIVRQLFQQVRHRGIELNVLPGVALADDSRDAACQSKPRAVASAWRRLAEAKMQLFDYIEVF
jgi:hypothetical protein